MIKGAATKFYGTRDILACAAANLLPGRPTRQRLRWDPRRQGLPLAACNAAGSGGLSARSSRSEPVGAEGRDLRPTDFGTLQVRPPVVAMLVAALAVDGHRHATRAAERTFCARGAAYVYCSSRHS